MTVLVFSYSPTAFAAVPPECGGNEGGTGLNCHEKSSSTSTISAEKVSVGTAASGRGKSSGSTVSYVAYNRLTMGTDGRPCITTGYVEESGTPSDMAPDPNQNHTEVLNGSNLTGQYPPCPQQPRAPGQADPVMTRTMVAELAWEQRVPLPKPAPSIAPGRAITGKLAYLETKGQLSHTYTEDTVFGPLYITARGSYTVAWGDGVTTGPHGFEGLPWPSGQITHDYIDVGAYDIVVTEKWTATWSLDGESGVLRTLQTTGRIDDFPVAQIQAVIGR